MTASLTQPRTTPPALRGRDVLLVLLACLGAMVLLAAVGVVLAALGVVADPYGIALAVLLGTVGAWSALWLLLVRRHGWGWREMGFVPGTRWWHLLWQVPAALTASLVGAAVLGAVLGLSPADGGSAQRDLVDAALVSPWLLLPVAACAVLVLPAAEEVLFRRVLLDWALTRTPALLAVPLTAAAFAVVHLAPAAMVYVLGIGIATALLRLWHGTLWAPLVLHAVNNAIVVLVTVRML